jgi:ABC transporter DrrB family efflux protein
MTAATTTVRSEGFSSTLTDIGIVTRRNLVRVVRNPRLILFSTVQPIMFLVLFNYVFGGALSFGGPIAAAGNYINWLIPGILVQSATFGSQGTAIGLTEDLQAGVIDRFRSLPMSRSAVLAGRTLADIARLAFVLALMLIVGFFMGWSPTTGAGEIVAAYLVAVGFGYAMSWVMATIGLAVKSAEVAQIVAFLPLFPLVFASSVFVPVETMPDWLAAFAEHQPITAITNAIRGLTLGGLETGDLVAALAWIVGITAVFAPFAIRMYRRASD